MKTGTKVMAVVVVAFLATGGEAMAAKRPRAKVALTGQLNLNTATPQQIDLLPGLGQKAVKRITDYRQKTPFARVEELVKVKGFGKKTFDRLKPFLSVSGPTTLAVAKAPAGGAAEGKASPAAMAPAAQGRSAPPKR